MKVSYYPGCSLEGTAKDYALSIKAVLNALDIQYRELDDWNCCGATAAHSINHEASILLPGRNLSIAESAGDDMIVPCPLCFNRLKTAEKELLSEQGRHYGVPFEGKITIFDLANFLARDEVLERLEQYRQQDFGGIKAVCYYGCMAARPPRVTDEHNPENPQSMDRILDRLGVEVKPWSYKTDCCGASHALSRRDLMFELVGKLYRKAHEAGANCIVVSCQMCQANLDMYQGQIANMLGEPYYFPILYITELIGLAMGLSGSDKWFKGHFIDPRQLFERAGLKA